MSFETFLYFQTAEEKPVTVKFHWFHSLLANVINLESLIRQSFPLYMFDEHKNDETGKMMREIVFFFFICCVLLRLIIHIRLIRWPHLIFVNQNKQQLTYTVVLIPHIFFSPLILRVWGKASGGCRAGWAEILLVVNYVQLFNMQATPRVVNRYLAC